MAFVASHSLSWREVDAYPAKNGISVYFRDVTEQRRAADQLKQNEERFRALIENSADGITLLNSDGTIIDISLSGERLVGYPKKELLGKLKLDVIHPDDTESVKLSFAEIKSKPGGSITGKYRVKHSDGYWLWIEAIWSNLLENDSVRAVN